MSKSNNRIAAGSARKTKCPLTKAEFAAKAKAITVTVNGSPFLVAPKEFSTGSFGWYLNGKTVVEIDGAAVEVQMGASFTVIGSKDAG